MLELVDGDARSALGLADSLIEVSAGDSTMLARVAALRSFARYRSYFNDTADEYLDSAALARLRMMGKDGLPYLIRGLFSEGNIAFRNRRYQDALNLMGECAYRSLYQAHDTFIAARAYEALGSIYGDGRQILRANSNNAIAIQLYRALLDTVNVDYTYVSLAHNLSQAYDLSFNDSACYIVDSISLAHKDDERYLKDLSLRSRTVYAHLHSNRYHQAIENARCLLHEANGIADSASAFYVLFIGNLRLGNYEKANIYLDTLKVLSNMYNPKHGSLRLFVTEGELELLDSINRRNGDRMISELVQLYRKQNDTLIARQQSYPGDIEPQFSLDFPQEDQHASVWILVLISIILAVLMILYYHKSKGLKDEQLALNNRLTKLQGELCRTLEKSAKLENDLKQRISENDNLEANVSQLNELVRQRDATIQEIQSMLSRSRFENKINSLPEAERKTVIESIIYKNKLISRLYRILSDISPKSSPIEIKAMADKTENLFSNISFEDIRTEIDAELRFRFDDWDFIYNKVVKTMSESNVQILMLLLYLPDIGIITRLTGLKRSTIYNRREIIVSELPTITSPSIDIILNLINRRSR